MFDALGGWAYRRRWLILLGSVLFLVLGGGWGTGVFGSLTGGGFDDPHSDSFRGRQLLEHRFGRADADVIALYTSRQAVDSGAIAAEVERTLRSLAQRR